MTDEPHESSADEVDLLIAAYVDGVATPDERARVEADPELMEIVARHEEVKSILGEVPHVSESRREPIIAAALAAYRTARAPDGDERRRLSGSVPRAGQHHDSSRSSMRWIGAAAAVIAAVGGLAVLASTVDQGEDDSATNDASSGGADTTSAGGGGAEQRAGRTADRQAPADRAAGSTGTTAAGAATTTPDADQSSGATTPASHAPGEEDTGYAEGPLARTVLAAGQTRVCAVASDRGARSSFAARFRNDDDDAITIEKVSLDDLNGLRLVGVAFDPSSTFTAETATGYPPAETALSKWDHLTMALDNGVTIAAGDDARLVLGFELERRTSGTARGMRIRYAQNGRTFEVVLDRTFMISKQCTPPGGG